MLTSTFLHIPYINEKAEQRLWRANIRTWDECLLSDMNMPNKALVKKHIVLSKENYALKNHEFFSRRLMYRYHWRAYRDFIDRCCFLDIETTGLDKNNDDITLIGIYNRYESKVFINGINLDEFEAEIRNYSYIVTFNGLLFDIPFIKQKFPSIVFNQFHADLRFCLKNMGYCGGLKNIEKRLGIAREREDMNGLEAIRLWQRYKDKKDGDALQMLIAYNTEDIKNLKLLMDFVYERQRAGCLVIQQV